MNNYAVEIEITTRYILYISADNEKDAKIIASELLDDPESWYSQDIIREEYNVYNIK